MYHYYICVFFTSGILSTYNWGQLNPLTNAFEQNLKRKHTRQIHFIRETVQMDKVFEVRKLAHRVEILILNLSR